MRKMLLAGAMLSAVSLVGGTSQADVAAARVTGNGTISPGLTTTPTAQTVTFGGTATVDAGTHAGSYTFTFSGGGAAETTAFGNGSGTLSGGLAGPVTYSRTGNHVTVSGSVSVGGGPAHTIVTAQCVFGPTSVNPTTTYTLACTAVVQ